MKFYGTKNALNSWSVIVTEITGKPVSEIQSTDNRFWVDTPLDASDREALMTIWYEKEIGQDMPWNWRIVFFVNSEVHS